MDKNTTQDEQLVVYNRVPKCGSRSIQTLLWKNSKTNHFNFISSKIYRKRVLQEGEQADLIYHLSRIPRPALFDRHLHFLNFTKFGKAKPTYINIIRDPLTRVISGYYYNRFGDKYNNYSVAVNFKNDMNKILRILTFDECVLQNANWCSTEHLFANGIIPFFCGQAPHCREPSTRALDDAKKNVIDEYIFVGLLEEFETSIKMLELLLPRYFKSSGQQTDNSDFVEEVKSKMRSSRIPPSEEVVQIMKNRLALEYDFYEFIKVRFSAQKEQLGIS
ncbi:uronyl 2-sulfotransferase-like [Glandiceps talaboti]